jgi:hypothetical protein
MFYATQDIPANTELSFWYQVLGGYIWGRVERSFLMISFKKVVGLFSLQFSIYKGLPCQGFKRTLFQHQVPTGASYEETQRGLQGWGFECKCAICLDARDTPKKLLDKRSALLGDLQTTLSTSKVVVANAERLLSALDKTYKSAPSKVPRLQLWQRHLHLARIYAERQDAAKAVSQALKSLESLGFVIKGGHLPASSSFVVEQWGLMMDGVIEAWIHLGNAYAVFAPNWMKRAEDYARVAYRVCVGEDVTFEEGYGEGATEAAKA